MSINDDELCTEAVLSQNAWTITGIFDTPRNKSCENVAYRPAAIRSCMKFVRLRRKPMQQTTFISNGKKHPKSATVLNPSTPDRLYQPNVSLCHQTLLPFITWVLTLCRTSLVISMGPQAMTATESSPLPRNMSSTIFSILGLL